MKNLKRLLYLKFARKMSNSEPAPVPSIISEGTKVKGNITNGGVIHIDGKLDGDIVCEELVIGIKGSVKGSVKVNDLHLYGVLNGRANVENLFVAKTAKLIGDASHSSIAIEPGAYIDGHCIRNNGDSSYANNSSVDDLEIVEVKGRRRAG